MASSGRRRTITATGPRPHARLIPDRGDTPRSGARKILVLPGSQGENDAAVTLRCRTLRGERPASEFPPEINAIARNAGAQTRVVGYGTVQGGVASPITA